MWTGVACRRDDQVYSTQVKSASVKVSALLPRRLLSRTDDREEWRRPPGHINIPADLADKTEARRYLADCFTFEHADESNAYLDDSLERFRVTMAVLESVPANVQVLELGSNPYFLTRLLRRRGYHVTCANYFGPQHAEPTGSQTATRSSDKGTETFDYDHFNIEVGSFPYAGDSFDLVLFCEILEHLPFDPINALGEIHRVLRQGSGQLLVTTPNPARAGNVARILRGENVYESLSGYGPYGRHNREYTLDELRRLLESNGFVVTEAFTADVHAHDQHLLPSGPNIVTENRGDNHFVLARAEGRDRWHYPDWLFSSKHGLYGRRVVAPGVLMGSNDSLQASGMHPLEVSSEGQLYRWMDAGTNRFLTVNRGERTLLVEGFTPPIAADALAELTCEVGGKVRTWKPDGPGPFVAEFDVEVTRGDHEVHLSASPTWCPADSGGSADVRNLGMGIISVQWRDGQPGAGDIGQSPSTD